VQQADCQNLKFLSKHINQATKLHGVLLNLKYGDCHQLHSANQQGLSDVSHTSDEALAVLLCSANNNSFCLECR